MTFRLHWTRNLKGYEELMRRGFKAEAERMAADIRQQLGCEPDDRLSLDRVAEYLGVTMIAADSLVPHERLEELYRLQPDAFSAGTFQCADGRRVVVYNPLHSQGRTRSNQAHELAHIMLEHEVRTIEQVGNLKFLTCDVEQEEEADWLGGCLLLPRNLLWKSARRGMTPSEIAAKYETSETMARFRLNASGVLVQLGRLKGA